ncbi:hypothetical protein F5878DRAFT_526023 [Lentinula raphanica]|uniref:Uncharacterized protein n=1 Tax=Lentinula raphanica TaxID=153919 RepID=A0AA38UK43_9AGAR|nr:hypothetical protein F5878DRAFT_526023 [Lentinula raphanica]
MQRSPKSPVDPHDAHLRRLLDQRATRADLHSRVPSLSDCSDTPSLYSHAYFSPQPAHFNSSLDEMSSNLASPIRSERDRFNDLAVSMLDMDDEPRSSYSSNEYDDLDGGDQSTIEQHQEEDEDELAMPRMSMLGPKMRFHSKAPWETDDSFAQQEEDSEDDAETHSIMSSSNRSKGGPARHFRFGGSKSGNNGRSSRESSRSRRKMKKSFDTTSSTNSHGRSAVHTLAQATLSSTSLVPGGPRQPFPSSRVRSVSPSSARFSPSSPRSPTFSGNAVEGALTNRSSSSADSEPRPSFAYSVEDTHPYARSNASVHMEQHPPFLSRKIELTDIPRSETSSTLTGSNAPYIPPNKQPQALAPAPLVQEPVPQSPRLQAFGREISSPVSFRGTAHIGDRSDINAPRTVDITGWTERAVSPSFNLISLEEARAQRSRSITSQSTTANPSFSSIEDRQTEQNVSQSVTSRARARSISAGARAKQALTNMVGNTPPKQERRGSEPAIVVNATSDGKALRHKKSGLMRLFNGGRDEKTPPPPVPSLSEGFAAYHAQQTSVPKGIKVTRVPPPQVSPSMFEKPQYIEDVPSLSPRLTSSPKHTPPPLNIVGSNHVTGHLRPSFPDDVAKSAPANVGEFPSLKLRPISTVFSAHFGDHILPSLTSDDEPDTPSSLQSPTTAISPVTPGPYSRLSENKSNHKPSGSNTAPAEDQSAVIRALQDQIVTAKRAWQQQIWELEGQVRDLKAEVEDLRNAGNEAGYCELCGRGPMNSRESSGGSSQGEEDKKPVSVVNRPRARTGTGQSRFGSAV